MADSEYKAKISIDADVADTEKNLKELQSLFNSVQKGVSRLNKKINILDESDYTDVMNFNKSLENLRLTMNKIYNLSESKNLGSSFDVSLFASKLSPLEDKLYELGHQFKFIREESSKLNFTRGLSPSPNKTLNTGSNLTNEQYKQQLEKVLLDVDKNLTAEQRKRIELAQQEYKKKQESIALAQREAQIAERLKNAKLSGLETSIPKLKSDLDSISSRFSNIFSSGNFAGLKSANNDLSGIRSKITEIRSIILQLQTQGVDVSRYKEQLSSIASQYSGLVDSVSRNIKSKLSSSIKNVVNVANSFANTSIKKISDFAKSSIKSTGSYLSKLFGTLFNSLKSKFSGIFSSKNTGVSNLTSQLKSLAMGYASIYGVIRLIKESIKLSSQLFEVQNVVNNVFKESTDSINDFTENAVSKFGLTELAAKQMIGVFGGILSASNITGNAQAEMSKNLTAFTGDLASFYNLDFETVNKKLQSGLVGNTAAMRSFGVNMTVANLEAYALSKGITQSYRDMNQATKTTLRYNYMLEQLSVAQGDFSRTSASWSNQLRLLTNNFKQLLSLIGGGFIKLFYPVLTLLNEIVSASVRAMTALSKVFGFSPADLSDLFGGSGATADVSDYTSDLEGVADATDKVAKSTKKANDNLQSFDKLNNITRPTDSSADKKTSTIDPGKSLIDPISYYDKVKDVKKTTGLLTKFLDELWDAINNRDFKKAGNIVASGINSIVKSIRGKLNDPKLFKSIDKFTDYFTDFIDGFLDVIDTREIGRALQDFIYVVAYTINSAFDNAINKDLFSKLGSKIADFFNGLFEDPQQWYEIGKALTSGIRAAFEILAGFLEKANPEDWGISIKNFFLGAIDRLFGNGGAETIGNDLAGVLNAGFKFLISTFGDGKLIGELTDSIVKTINTAIEGINKEDLAGAFTTIIKNISSILKSISSIDTDTLTDDISFTINSAVDSGVVSDLVESITNVLIKLVDVGIQLIKKIDWSELIEAFWEGLSNAFEGDENGDAKKTLKTIVGLLIGIKTIKFVWNVSSAISGVLKLAKNIASLSSKLFNVIPALTTFGSKILSILSSVGSLATRLGSSLIPKIASLGSTVKTASKTLGSLVTSTGGILAGGALVAAGTVASGVETYKSYKNKSNFEDSINEDKFHKLFDVDNLKEYTLSLYQLDSLYKNLGKDASVEDFTMLLNKMKSLGMENTDVYKNLSDAINNFNNASWIDQNFNADLNLAMESAAADVEAKVVQTQNSIINMSDNTVKALEESMSGLTTGGSWATEQLDTMYSTGSDSINSYKDGFESGVAGASVAIDKYIRDTTKGAKETSASEGKDIGGNILDGIGAGVNNKDKQDNVLNIITGFINDMVTWFTTKLAIHSPSRVFKSLAMYIPEGVAVGIEDGSKNAISAIGGMCGSLSDEFENSEIDTSSLINTDKFSGMFEKVYSEADVLLDTLKSKFSNVSDLLNISSDMVVTPKIKQSELNALLSQQSSNVGVVNSLGNLYSKLNSLSSSDSSKNIHVDVYLDKNNKLESFILDTVNGNKIRTGGF